MSVGFSRKRSPSIRRRNRHRRFNTDRFSPPPLDSRPFDKGPLREPRRLQVQPSIESVVIVWSRPAVGSRWARWRPSACGTDADQTPCVFVARTGIERTKAILAQRIEGKTFNAVKGARPCPRWVVTDERSPAIWQCNSLMNQNRPLAGPAPAPLERSDPRR